MMAPTRSLNTDVTMMASQGVVALPPGLALPPVEARTGSLSPSASRATAAESKAGRHFIWCHEFCHHADNRQRRQLIKKSFGDSYTITHLKKSVLFAKWLEETEASDEYLLVMGWREAQPCLRYIAQSGRAPTMTIIVCEGVKQYTRASNYALTLSQNMGPVKVFMHDEIPENLHGGLIRECFGSTLLKDEASEVVEPMPVVRTQKKKISLQDELAKLTIAVSSDASSTATGFGSGCTTPTEEEGSSSEGVSFRTQLNLHQAFVAALEKSTASQGSMPCTPSGKSASTTCTPSATPVAQRHIGKGKGNGLPATRPLFAR